MEAEHLTPELLHDALAALEAAAGDLTLAALAASPTRMLAQDLLVLAQAVELEASALAAVIARHKTSELTAGALDSA